MACSDKSSEQQKSCVAFYKCKHKKRKIMLNCREEEEEISCMQQPGKQE
jgi:hypothetical protein